MVLHAAVDFPKHPFSVPYLTVYDSISENFSDCVIPEKIFADPELLAEYIKCKMTGNLGCICICTSNYLRSRNTLKGYMTNVLEIGFEKVKIIDQRNSMYFHATYFSNYIPQNEDVIWIFDGSTSVCQLKNGRTKTIDSYQLYIFHRLNHKANFILTKNFNDDLKTVLEEILRETNMPPNIILYRDVLKDQNFKAPVKDLFPKCEFFQYFFKNFGGREKAGYEMIGHYSSARHNNGAIIKARIMANDPVVMEYDANPVLSQDLCLTTKMINDIRWFNTKLSLCETQKQKLAIKGIQRFIKEGQSLPFSTTAIIKSNDYKNVISVMSPYYNNLLSACLPINKKLAVTLSVDENQILDLDIKFLKKIKPKSRKTKYSLPQKFTLDQINPEKMPYAFGIDFGTTRCYATVKRRNGIITVALENENRFLPSYVAFDEGKGKCGQIVINRLRYHAKSSIFDTKRIIGKKFEDIKIDQSWPFQVIRDKKNVMLEYLTDEQIFTLNVLENNDTFIKSETTIGTLLFCPELIAAILFKHIKRKVEEFEGKYRKRVMITIPATFTDSQKDSTCAAAILAGFKIVDFMPEPVAAAFGYLIVQPPTDHNFTFLLFDLGGGTLDICIFKFERNEIEILCQNGNQNLGGRDFDNILINYFSQKLFYDYGINDFGSKKYKLMLACQKIKENLSIDDEDVLEIDEIVSSIEETIEITRREFEELSTELIEKIKTCILNALKECKFKTENINKILLVGGGSRMPMIKELLRNLFPNSEHLCAKNPEEIVAVGAAYYSCYLASLLIEDKKFLELTEYQHESEEENEEEISSYEEIMGFFTEIVI